ncbi:hypothetical protein GCM10023185_10270 [Hymenobacter saemangeumensis]|uniref:T9SS type A sorting domain-containing protein n=1 Tax=Hymenobacter saemangeumensis TaxID=1084522 RepID=A0ABP8I5B0_9BACT
MRSTPLFYLSILLLGFGFTARAQQLVCERELRTLGPASIRPSTLLRLQPDSLRLLSDYNPSGPNQLQVRLLRVGVGQCDTLTTRTATLGINGPSDLITLTATNRRGQVLLTQSLFRPQAAGAFDSIRIVLQLLDRDGRLRWRRVLTPQAPREGISGVLEAPTNGFFLVGSDSSPGPTGPPISYDFVLRIDSTGRELWRRRYRQLPNVGLINPAYTLSGHFVCISDYFAPGQFQRMTIREFNQRGDSLSTRHIIILPQQLTRVPFYNVPNSLIPLRDGGFALVGQVDSANTSYYRPFLSRLSPQGAVVWSYVYRPQATQFLRFAQPQELADGSLVVVASNQQSGRGYPFWLFRFSATGTLQQRYPFVSQVLTANTNGGRNGFFGVAQGLQPLSDSTFIVAAGSADNISSRIYLAHLRVPGLPRVIDSHYVPAADPLTTRAPVTAWPGAAAYPNPATDQLTLPYRLPPGARTARLLVHDALGRAVHAQALDPRQPQAVLPLAGWPPGLYLFSLLVDGQVRGRQRVAVAH